MATTDERHKIDIVAASPLPPQSTVPVLLVIHCTFIVTKEGLRRWQDSVESLVPFAGSRVFIVLCGYVDERIVSWSRLREMLRLLSLPCICISVPKNTGKVSYVDTVLDYLGLLVQALPRHQSRSPEVWVVSNQLASTANKTSDSSSSPLPHPKSIGIVMIVDSDMCFPEETWNEATVDLCIEATLSACKCDGPWNNKPVGILCPLQLGDVRQIALQRYNGTKAQAAKLHFTFDPVTPTGTGGGVMFVRPEILQHGFPRVHKDMVYQAEDLMICAYARSIGYVTGILSDITVYHPVEQDEDYALWKKQILQDTIAQTNTRLFEYLPGLRNQGRRSHATLAIGIGTKNSQLQTYSPRTDS